ncbi:MAG: type II secretion system protein GspL [Gammaproteobacteria bacterium]|nr:type II secretion system protein GspL [Gammaproteobacteria bacterium]
MRDQIIIRMPAEGRESFSWVKLSSAIISPIIEHGELESLVSASIGFQVVVLVPGSDAVLLDVSVPTQNKQRMLKAIRYANEEELATDVESLHFSLGSIESKNTVPVAVVEIALMDQWQALFQSVGLAVDVMMPETLAIPFAENQLNIVIEEHAAYFRGGDYDAFYVDIENLKLMLSLWLKDREVEEKNLPETIVVWGDESGLISSVDIAEEIQIEHKSASKGLLGILASQPLNFEKTINLLQGDYSRREQLGKIWRPWRLAASLAGVLFILQLGLAITQSSSLEAQTQALKAEVNKIYKDAFPDARRVVNARRQMEQKLKELKGGGSSSSITFLTLLADTSPVFKATSGLNLQSIRYKNQMLDVEIEVPNYQVLDQLKQKLTKEGERSVEIQSAVTRNNIVQGRLQIKGLAS